MPFLQERGLTRSACTASTRRCPPQLSTRSSTVSIASTHRMDSTSDVEGHRIIQGSPTQTAPESFLPSEEFQQQFVDGGRLLDLRTVAGVVDDGATPAVDLLRD